jgi:hypothetical protein
MYVVSMFTKLFHKSTFMLSFQVAARVKSDDEKDEWFVVKVIHFDKETKEYVSIYSLPSVVHAFLLI